MLALRDLQAGFAADLTGTGLKHLDGLVSTGKYPAEALFGVYRNNYFLSLTEALRAVYVSTEKLVGEGFFSFAADGYIRQFPSRTSNLHGFGDRFPYFLSELMETQGLPYLQAVASIDWAWHMAYHAADAMPVEPDSMAVIDPANYGRLVFDMHPSLSCIRTEYTVHKIWHVCRDERSASEVRHLQIEHEAGFVAVFRNTLNLHVEKLDAAEFRLLHCLQSGFSLESAANQAMAECSDFDLLESLQRFFAFNLVTRVRLPESVKEQ